MTTIDKTGKIVSQFMENYTDRKESDIFAAIAKQIIHFKSDITTSMGLPAPLMGLFNLLQFGKIGDEDQTIAEIVQGMYYEGYDFIHFSSMAISTMIIEVIIRIGYALKKINEGHSRNFPCKCIKDTKEFTLEQSIPEIIVLIYQEYYKVKNLRLEREERERLYEEEQERKRKLQNKIEEEKKRTMSLLNMLEDFQTANDLRLMADKLEIAGKLSKEEIDWIRSKADWIDPIVSSTDELLGIRNHENSREQKEQYLSEKRYYW